MEFTHRQTVKIVAVLLFLAAISQPLYTALYIWAPDVNRLFIWRFEALIFVILLAFAGSALVTTRRYTLAFSAIAFSAVLNIIQVGVGLTQFGPVRAAAQLNGDIGGVASSVFAFSFFGYNAAKALLALAAIIIGLATIKYAKNALSKPLGGLCVLVGVLAFIANALVMMLGTRGFVPRPLAGGSGVAATILLAICLYGLRSDDERVVTQV